MGELEEFLETFVPRQEAADDALHNGDAEPRKQLWSREDPVTLLGAFGVAASRWEEVDKTFEWVASKFTKGESFRLEVIAAGVSGDLPTRSDTSTRWSHVTVGRCVRIAFA